MCEPWWVCDWILCMKEAGDAGAFSLAQRAQVSAWLPKPELRLQQCLCPFFPELRLQQCLCLFFAPSVEFTEQLTLHGSPFLQAEVYFCIPELQKSYEPSATKPVSWGCAISTIEISSFKPWLSSLPWLCRFPSLSWKDGAQGTHLIFLKECQHPWQPDTEQAFS